MFEDDEDIEVTVVDEESSDDDTEEVEVEVKPKPKDDDDDDDLASQSESVRKRIGKLTYKVRETERREQAALDYAKSVKSQLEAMQKRTSLLDQSYTTEADTRIKVQEQLYKDQYRSAIDTGDTDKQIEANQYLAKLELEREKIRNYRYQLEQQTLYDQQSAQQVAAPRREPVPDEKAQQWAERNEWFGSDKAMTYTAYDTHNDLVAEGFNPSSDAYYRELDRRIRNDFPHKFAKGTKPVSAVGGARPTSAQKTNKAVKGDDLSTSQKKIAKALGLSYEQYARQVNLKQAERN
jgi:hypothetical protein